MLKTIAGGAAIALPEDRVRNYGDYSTASPEDRERMSALWSAGNDERKEKLIAFLFKIPAILAVGSVVLIALFLLTAGLPAIGEIGIFEFLFGRVWAPTAQTPAFGIMPFILTSIYGMAGALVLGLPIGFFTAVYLAKQASPRVRAVVSTAVDLLSGIPSVVYGMVGMMVLVPAVGQAFGLPDGAGLFTAIIVLTVMILPTVISVSVTALEAVPREYEEASLALGATKVETFFRVTAPAAKSGITAAVALGCGRALGEAMAVMMVSGNVANMPELFGSVRFLTTAVAGEMGYAAGLQREALFSIALVLLTMILLLNSFLNRVMKGREA